MLLAQVGMKVDVLIISSEDVLVDRVIQVRKGV